MAIFSSKGQTQAVTVSVHPRTTKVVVQQGAASNVLVGYVRVQVHRATEMSSLTVQFAGTQRLDMRVGQGPSSSQYSIRTSCADLVHTVATNTTSTDSLAAAMLAELSRVRSGRRSDVTSPPEFKSYAEEETHGALSLTSFSSNSTNSVELREGEYRFVFELELPPRLPSSVKSALGRVEYHVGAVLRRPTLFQSTVEAPHVSVQVVQAPPLHPGSHLLHGHASFAALASSPLSFDTQVREGWRVFVSSPSSQALFVGAPLKLHVYLAREGSGNQQLELTEFGVTLHETITHMIPGSAAQQTTERVVTTSSLCPLTSDKQRDAGHVLDAQTIDALGESFDELPSTGALTLWLPQTGPQAVHPTAISRMFAVAHRLTITVRVCEVGGYPSRVSFATRVLVLPEALAPGDQLAAPLPCYSRVNGDVVLESAARPDSALSMNPPAYASLSNL
ncbi:hypothetical protein GGH12_002576 [Coemansia sp. RSA 1822]|nr:hypothetical protein LPJ76_005088 [Coemansia sp. RSA 638]KAJ2539801.1 hypothetical protein GGF49_004963 [Coemansia sp. RSA 1853]KAJ2563399.1 hypothetical protein GGH12_002576 [Coemansia sp. RSA 1822]